MNKEETMKAIEVMMAYVDGKEIITEAFGNIVPEPEWKWGLNKYLVKPDPIVRWLIKNHNGGEIYIDEIEYNSGAWDVSGAIKLVEETK